MSHRRRSHIGSASGLPLNPRRNDMSSSNQRSKDTSTAQKLVDAGESSGKSGKSRRDSDGDPVAGGKCSTIPKKQGHSTSHKIGGTKS